MKPNEDLLSELICNAESGKHRPFQYLISWREYSRAKKIRRAHRLLVATIKQSTSKLFKKYCEDVAAGETDVIKLLAYCTTRKVLRFYEEELDIINNMIVEYECYLAAGNWTDFLFSTQRPADKLWDHRGE